MCKSKAEGGYRCARHGEQRRRELTRRVHDGILGLVPDAEREFVGAGFDLPQSALRHIEREVDQDGYVRVAMARVLRAEKAFAARRDEVRERIEAGDLHGAMMNRDERYRRLYTETLEREGPEVAARIAESEEGYLRASVPGSDNEVLAERLMYGSPEYEERAEAYRLDGEARKDAAAVRREEMCRMVDPRFRKAMKAYMSTKEGRRAMLDLASLRVEIRFSEAHGSAEYHKSARTWRSIGVEGSEDMADLAEATARQYEEAYDIVGSRNRAEAYVERVKMGKFIQQGEEVKINGGLIVVHPSDQRPGECYYREGTEDCRIAVGAEYLRVNDQFKQLVLVELDRLSGTRAHSDKM